MIRKILVLAALLVSAGIAGCSQEEATSELIQPSEWWRVHPRPVYATLEHVGTYQEWFEVYRLAEGTYALYEPNQFEEAISYLVLGTERGVLIDAGTGIGDIRQVVEELTDLPVSVVLTHEHYDHIGGAYRFDEIAAPSDPAGLAVLAAGRDSESLQGYITDDYLWKPLPEGFDGPTWTIPPIVPTQLLEDGDIIDLGGRTLEVIETPGHSPAHICLLDRENRLLWTGDHFFPGPLYAFGGDVNIDDYIASNERLVGILDQYDYVLAGHNDPWVESDVIRRVGEAFEAIAEGTAEYSEDDGLRRYFFQGFDVLIRAEMVEEMAS
ncbi:MAG: MBL fold metallo-hydrolase [Gemmatimonadetes bacterium]|nr:MBL fold metallo-hydrolase [Gemmatimonadota bacterium]NIO32737.1 MBL fold metallo-hydrolase [Gemmatimonadota bacterium]